MCRRKGEEKGEEEGISPSPLSLFQAEHLELHMKKLKSWAMRTRCMGFFIYIPWVTIKSLYFKNQCMGNSLAVQ